VETVREIQSLLDNRHEKINTDCNPYFGFYPIAEYLEKRLDQQMLFDPLEKQLYLPA